MAVSAPVDPVATPDPLADRTLVRLTEHARALLPVAVVMVVTGKRFAAWFANPGAGSPARTAGAHALSPSVDIRAGMPMASRLVAPGRNMMGAQAGCRHLARVPAYLNNLSRLGLIWFSRESLEDPARYQVLEAQPEVVEAMRKAGRTGRTVRRSILLTPFGRDFCDAVLPFRTAEPDALSDPGTSAPADGPD